METNMGKQLVSDAERVDGIGEESFKPLSQRLTFPTLEVNNTLASLASSTSDESTPNPSTTMRTRPRSPSASTEGDALEESYVDIQADTVSTASEDEDGHTASITSGDRDTPDDLSSIADTDFAIEEQEGYDHITPDMARSTRSVDGEKVEPSDAMEDSMNGTFSMESTLTGKPLEESSYGNHRFQRDLNLRPDEQLLSLHIGNFTSDSPDWLQRLRCEHVRVDVLQIITNNEHNILTKSRTRQLQVLLLGFADDHIIAQVQEKIQEAVRVAQETTRARGCPSINFTTLTPGECPSSIHPHPDLVVFYHDPDQQISASESKAVRLYKWLSHAQVPSLDIASRSAEVEFPEKPALATFDYDPRNLHTRISDSTLHLSERNVLQTNPVSLDTFLALDPLMLSKHLAYIMDTPEDEPEAPSTPNILKKHIKSFKAQVSHWPLRRLLALLGVVVLHVCVLFWQRSSPSLNDVTIAPAITENPNHVEVVPTSVSVSFTPECSVPPSLPVPELPATRALVPSVSKALGQPLNINFSPSTNDSREFKAQVVGSNIVVLVPPKSLAQRRKKYHIAFQAQRRSTNIQIKVSKLDSGVYALEFPHNEAYGNIKLQLWTDTKPKLDQTIDINLGSYWSKVADLRKAIIDMAMSGYDKIRNEPAWDPLKQDTTDAQSKFQQAGRVFTEQARRLEQAILETNDWMVQQAKTTHQKLAKRRESVKAKVSFNQEERQKAMTNFKEGVLKQIAADVRALNAFASATIVQQVDRVLLSLRTVDPMKMWQDAPSTKSSKQLKKAKRNAQALVGKLKKAESKPSEVPGKKTCSRKTCKHRKNSNTA